MWPPPSHYFKEQIGCHFTELIITINITGSVRFQSNVPGLQKVDLKQLNTLQYTKDALNRHKSALIFQKSLKNEHMGRVAHHDQPVPLMVIYR